MNDLVVGLGIALVMEGLLWALLPHVARRMVFDMARLEDGQVRGVAWMAVAAGCLLVWMVRG